jgi:hypothetical protein
MATELGERGVGAWAMQWLATFVSNGFEHQRRHPRVHKEQRARVDLSWLRREIELWQESEWRSDGVLV